MQLLFLKWIKSHNKPCKCWNCDLIFTANISLKDHISSLHQNKTLEMPTLLWCDICGKHFLEDHISSPHQNNKPCNCDDNLTWHFSVKQSQRFSIFFGLLRISELYWSNLEACCWMILTGKKIWKTKMGMMGTIQLKSEEARCESS